MMFLVFLVAYVVWGTPAMATQLADVGQHSSSSAKLNKMLPNGASFHSTDCWFDTSQVPVNSELPGIECGWFYTAPVPGSSSSSFQLPVVVFRYHGEERQEDPLVYLAGGPGSGSWLDGESVTKYWFDWFVNKVKLKRDFILYDQRGSGLSLPELKCDDFKEAGLQILVDPGTPQENALRYREASVQCHARLKRAGLPIDEMGTSQSADDLSQLLTLLGYDKWNLYGVSYGTRLAIEAQTRYPLRVRSMVLDSVYSPQAHMFKEWPILYKESIDRIIDHCQRIDNCVIDSKVLKQRLWALLDRLRNNPISMDIPIYLSPDKASNFIINDETFLSIMFDSEYITGALEELPGLIDGVYHGKLDLLREFAVDYINHQFDQTFNDVAFWAIECRDNRPTEPMQLDKNPEYSRIKYYVPTAYNVCDIWRDGTKHEALTSFDGIYTDVPMLMFAGEDDPITPLRWAVKTAGFYNNKPYLFPFTGVSHSVMDYKYCTRDLFSSFLENPAERPRADCSPDEEYKRMQAENEKQQSEPVPSPREPERIRIHMDADLWFN
jgi:pimeloyl-ACP methyl ester carboxylesterase